MPRKTAKEAWRPKCAAPRLVYDSALFFEIFMHVFARTTYNQIYSAKKKKRPPPEGQVSGWTCRTCVQNLRVLSLKNGVDILTFVRKPFEIYVVARNYLVLMLDLSFCVMFHLIFSIGRSDLRMLRETFYRQACVGVDAVASFTKKKWGKKVFATETPDHFWHL